MIRMLLKSLKKIIETLVGEKGLQPKTITEIADWLHSLEFLAIKVIMFSLTIYHLYVYTMKTVF